MQNILGDADFVVSDLVFLNVTVYTMCETHFYDLVLPHKLVNDRMQISSVPSVLVT